MDTYFNVDIKPETGEKAFKESGLDYKKITWEDMRMLSAYITVELFLYKINVKEPIILFAHISNMTKAKRKVADFLGVEIDGTYFHDREAVTIYCDSHIRFCREMSGYNKIPIMQGFYKWLEAKKRAVLFRQEV